MPVKGIGKRMREMSGRQLSQRSGGVQNDQQKLVRLSDTSVPPSEGASLRKSWSRPGHGIGQFRASVRAEARACAGLCC